MSDSLAGVCSWEVIKRTMVGRDRYPIVIKVGESIEDYNTEGVEVVF